MQRPMNRTALNSGIICFPMTAMTAGAATWSYSDSSCPPDGTRNRNVDGNWNGTICLGAGYVE